MRQTLVSILVLCAVALLNVQGAQAAMKAHTITKQKTVGPYRIVLVIGPAAMMSMNGKSGEKMLGGKAATCHMGSMKSGSGMGVEHGVWCL